jgi:hypothetical protein
MKFSKNAFLILALLFSINFVESLFDKRTTHELFFWEVNILNYRVYRFLLVVLMIAAYLKLKKAAVRK